MHSKVKMKLTRYNSVVFLSYFISEVFHFALSNEIALTRSEFSSVRSNPPPLAPKNYESNDF